MKIKIDFIIQVHYQNLRNVNSEIFYLSIVNCAFYLNLSDNILQYYLGNQWLSLFLFHTL